MAATLEAPRETAGLTPRWTDRPLNHHPVQHRLWTSRARFCVIEAGRRSGKTELPKRKGVLEGQRATFEGYYTVFSAPTRDQARNIYWDDLLAFIPSRLIRSVSQTHLEVTTLNGARYGVVGLDKPQRIEGVPIDFFFGDEFAEVKDGTWDKTIRPCLSTINRPGRAWIYGVPRPSSQFKRLVDLATIEKHPDFEYFHWTSASVLPKEEVDAARASMDPLMFAQEYEASRVNLAGRAYYPFTRDTHAQNELPWLREATLMLSLDFNVSPGTAGVHHEFNTWADARKRCPALADQFTGTLGEVWIPRDSNTRRVCEALLSKYGEHKGDVLLYGDATGGAKGTAKVEGSDWDIAYGVLRQKFGERLKRRIARENPKERVRVNTLNARLMTADGKVRYQIDAKKAPHHVQDFEETLVLEGTAGELDKDSNPMATHLTDGTGYMECERHPLGQVGVRVHEGF